MPGHKSEVPGHEHQHRCRENKEVPPGEQKPPGACGRRGGRWPDAGHRA
jgi:hypothetical protein